MIERTVILSLLIAACAQGQQPSQRQSGGASRATPPIVSSTDTTWAALGRDCGAVEPVWNPPLDSAARELEHGRDARWASIARETPGGFAGLYLEGGRVVVLLTDTLQKEAALTGLIPHLERPGVNIEHARVAQARWDFAQLHDWWAYIAARRMRFDGLTSFDIDEHDNRLVYGFRDSTSRRRAEELIKPLELPCYLVAFLVEPPAQLR